MSESDSTDDWITLRDAEDLTGLARRTLYGRVERKQLASRVIDGVQHVRLSAVQALAAQRAAAAELPSNAPGNGVAAHSHFPAPPELAEARARVELRRAEAEELRAGEGVRQAREEVEAADAERAERRKRLALETERERLELEKARRLAELEWEQQRAAHDAEIRRRENEARRADERRQREEIARREELARQRWVQLWTDDVSKWVLETFGPRAVPRARAAARRAVESLPVDAPDSDVTDLINLELEVALPECFEAARAEEQREKRERLVREATDAFGFYNAEQTRRIRAAALEAAQNVDPEAAWAFRTVRRAALDEARIIDEETRARREARDQAAYERLEAAHREVQWTTLFAELPAIVRRVLPNASAAERERALAIVQQLYAERPPGIAPSEFEFAAGERVALLFGS